MSLCGVRRLKALLRTKLVECGWRDELKTYISDLIRSRGVDNVTADALIEEVTPYGKAQVPDEVQQHLVQQIRDFFSRVESQQGQ